MPGIYYTYSADISVDLYAADLVEQIYAADINIFGAEFVFYWMNFEDGEVMQYEDGTVMEFEVN
jgi:hypothetical protein